MAVLAVLALFGGHALAQWMSFPKPMYVGEIAELTWDLSNEEGLEAPVGPKKDLHTNLRWRLLASSGL